jgi:hypothetical protein
MSIEDDLRVIVREEIADAIRTHQTPPPDRPALLDRKSVARELGVSIATIDRLVREGMPHVRVGDCKRFELDRVLDWIRRRS